MSLPNLNPWTWAKLGWSRGYSGNGTWAFINKTFASSRLQRKTPKGCSWLLFSAHCCTLPVGWPSYMIWEGIRYFKHQMEVQTVCPICFDTGEKEMIMSSCILGYDYLCSKKSSTFISFVFKSSSTIYNLLLLGPVPIIWRDDEVVSPAREMEFIFCSAPKSHTTPVLKTMSLLKSFNGCNLISFFQIWRSQAGWRIVFWIFQGFLHKSLT